MEGKKPYVVVFVIQTIYAAYFLLSKAAFDHGMNNFIFVFYRQAVATIFLIPFAFIFEWKFAPPLSFRIFCKFFLLSFCGITLSLNIYGVGLIYTSPTLAAATANCLPVITFFLALILGVESLKIKTGAGIAKLLPHVALHHILWGLWMVLQAFVLKDYPSKLIFTTIQCFLSSIQSLVIALAIERDIEQWKLGWNITLLAVAYCGIIVTGVSYYLMTWVIEKKGPVFLAMSTPLALIITIFSSIILLGDIISLGSVLGGLLLVVGLSSVLWGKNREQSPKASQDLEQPSSV
ncbi:hypothetical protein P8452_28236 [Trifolium repens]|nr:hypothetical protein P8452_28236 [Trifolium repens]